MNRELELYFEKTTTGDRPILMVCERTKDVVSILSAFYGEDALRLYSVLTQQTEFGKILDHYAKAQQEVD